MIRITLLFSLIFILSGCSVPSSSTSDLDVPISTVDKDFQQQLPSSSTGVLAPQRDRGLTGIGEDEFLVTPVVVNQIPYKDGNLTVTRIGGETVPLKHRASGLYSLEGEAIPEDLLLKRNIDGRSDLIEMIHVPDYKGTVAIDFRISRDKVDFQINDHLEIFLIDSMGYPVVHFTVFGIGDLDNYARIASFYNYDNNRLTSIVDKACNNNIIGEEVFEYSADEITGRYYYDIDGYRLGSRTVSKLSSIKKYGKNFCIKSFSRHIYEDGESKRVQDFLLDSSSFSRYSSEVVGFDILASYGVYHYSLFSRESRIEGYSESESAPKPYWVCRTTITDPEEQRSRGYDTALDIFDFYETPIFRREFDKNGDIVIKIEFGFNSRKQLVHKNIFDKKGILMETEEIEYDNDGKISRAVLTMPGGRKIIKYDASR